jgi:hypothetical protein
MSWDIVLFITNQHITSIDQVDENQFIAIDFDEIISEHFGESFSGDGYSIDFYPDEEPAGTKMISLDGEKALFEIAVLAQKQQWQVFDTSLGVMLDLENPEKNGFTNFQKYLQKVLGKE